MPLIIGVGGKIGSGKTTIAETLSKKLECKYVSFGSYVRKVAKDRGVDISIRENLQIVGNSLIDTGVLDFCKNVLEYANWSTGESLVIEGIRHMDVLQCLKELTHPDTFIFVFLTVEEDIRTSRIKKRNILDFVNLENLELDKTEIEVKNRLESIADIVVNTDKESSKVLKKLLDFIEEKLIINK